MLVTSVIIGLLFGTATSISFVQVSPRELGKRFDRAQQLMVSGDFEGSIAQYLHLLGTPANLLLRPSRVTVAVGEERLPLPVAAAYQVASSFRRRGEERVAAESDSVRGLGRDDLRQASGLYELLAQDRLSPAGMAERAAFQVGLCRFKGEEYQQAVAALDTFQAHFPHSGYGAEARYYVAWSEYHLADWERAEAGFLQVARMDSSQDRVQRAWFQAGDCAEKRGRWPEALQAFAALAGAYQGPGTGKQRAQDVVQTLREGLTQTQRELVGKAHLRAGDACRHLDSLETAARWYQQAAARFAADQGLVEAAYLRLADLRVGQGKADEGLAALRQGLEAVQDPQPRAQLQAQYMALAYRSGRFAEAAQAHRFYVETYADQAAGVGVSVDQARLLAAESLRLEMDHPEGGATRDSLGLQALAAYRQLLERAPGDSLAAEACLGMGLCWQGLDSLAQAQQAFVQVGGRYPDTRAGTWGRLLQARGCAAQGDTAQACALYEGLRTVADTQVRDAARVELAPLWAAGGRRAEALALLSSVAPGSVDYGRARAALAAVHSAAQEWDQASQAVEEALRADLTPEMRADVSLDAATLGVQRRDWRGALRHLASVDTTRLSGPGVEQWLYLRAVCHHETGADSVALAELGACYRRTQDSALRRQVVELLSACAGATMWQAGGEALFRAWIEGVSATAERRELQLGLARFWYGRKDYRACLDELDHLGADKDQDPVLARDARLLRGEALVADGQWEAGEAALGAMEAAGLPRADAARHQYLLGLATMNLGEYEAAVEHWESLLALHPEPGEAREGRLYLGRCRYLLGQYGPAASGLDSLVTEAPDVPEASEAAFLEGECLYLGEQYQQAAAAYRRVQPGEHYAPAQIALAWCSLELGQEEQFLAQLQQVRQQFPETDQAREAAMLAGDYCYRNQDYAGARRAYQEVVDQYPGTSAAAQAGSLLAELADLEADLVYQAAMSTFDLGQYEQASLLLQSVIRRYPGTASAMAARCNLGAALEQLGREKEAAAVYDSLVVAAGDDPAYADMAGFAREHRTALGGE